MNSASHTKSHLYYDLGILVVVVHFLRLRVHVKDIINTSHIHNYCPPYQPRYSMLLTIPGGC
jgi:hypothetical protein